MKIEWFCQECGGTNVTFDVYVGYRNTTMGEN